MATEVILPRVDMDMATGRIARWFVGENMPVTKGQPLFEIETDKAAMDIEAPATGVLRNVVGQEGAEMPVGSTVAWILDEGETPAATPAPVDDAVQVVVVPDAIAAAPAPVDEVDAPGMAPAVDEESSDSPRATPLARRLARERGLDLATLQGSGPHGRIQSRDIPIDEEGAASSESYPLLVHSAVIARSQSGDEAIRGAALTSGLVRSARNDDRQSQAVASTSELHTVWLRRGEGAPIVMLHGFGADLNGWRPFLPSLAGRSVLAVDLPGHGGSVAASADTFDALVDAVEATLQAELQDTRRLHLVGHSLGGAVAAALAARATLDVGSLLLIAPAGLGPEINGAFIDGFARARGEASLAPWMRELVFDAAALPSAFVRTTARQRADGTLGAAQARLAATLFPDGTQAFSIRSCLARITAPVRLVMGEQDRVIPVRQLAGLPGAIAVHRFAAMGHMPQLENPAVVARILNEAIRSAAVES